MLQTLPLNFGWGTTSLLAGIIRVPSCDSFLQYCIPTYLKPLTLLTHLPTPAVRLPETAWKIRWRPPFIPPLFPLLPPLPPESLPTQQARWTLRQRRRSHEARRCFLPPPIALPRAGDGPVQVPVPDVSAWVHSHPLPLELIQRVLLAPPTLSGGSGTSEEKAEPGRTSTPILNDKCLAGVLRFHQPLVFSSLPTTSSFYHLQFLSKLPLIQRNDSINTTSVSAI